MADRSISPQRHVDKPTFIYGLVCPVTNQLRYVGKTINGLGRRLDSHLASGRRGLRQPCSLWIGALLKKGDRPDIFEIEVCSLANDWEQAEQFWIEYFRSIGCRLLNLAIGGGSGNTGCKLSPEGRRRRSVALTGRAVSAETRRKIGTSNTGKTRSFEDRRRNADSHRGEKSATAKITASDVPVIRALRAFGYSGNQVGALFGITKQAADAVFKRETWSHVPDSIVDISGVVVPSIRRLRGIENGTSKLDENAVLDIRRRLVNKWGKRGMHETGKALAAEYGVSTAVISAVRLRQTWKHID